ncbi:XdhC family protein [Methylomonas rapida]|uniref:XdhC family protein n=1 Tax=Methylomonas rapida TaxID=2963939 RepID=A0ABY7GQB8_9GAMM|nr:XdhC/CoxI family protein [Methylomonas rapida]WAR46683.1 XdhC family protein [Methylomonas rapida]
MASHHRLLAAYPRLLEQGQDAVLATVIETFGYTYQKAGTRMLIEANGRLSGLLGGGCFEADLIEHARDVLQTGKAKTVFYDLRRPEDELWGLGAGCHGATRIFLQRLAAADGFRPLNSIWQAAENREDGVLATIVESKHPGYVAGETPFLPLEQARAPWPFISGVPPRRPLLRNHCMDGLDIRVFYEPLRPPTHLWVLGAGDDAQPVVDCAKLLGWKVSVADHRPAYLTAGRFPTADALLHIRPEALNTHLKLNGFDAALVMSHNLSHDRQYLAALAASHIAVIGLLGPMRRRERLLNSLGEVGAELAERLYGPVGLDIGAETPEEIALAIVAGIQAALKGRGGGQLGFTLA